MKKSRYTDSQIMAILKQAEAGTPVPELCRGSTPLLRTLLKRGTMCQRSVYDPTQKIQRRV
jgi:hypothetical protein